MTISVSKSFTAASQVSATFPLSPGQPGTITITGTFVATLVLESTLNNGATWNTRATYTTTQTVIPLPVHPATRQEPIVYRVRCSAYTSGTAVVALATVAYPIQTIAAAGQIPALTVNDNGPVAPIPAATSLAFAAEDPLTAHAGGTQAAALALGAMSLHRVSVCATNADSVALPAATVGQFHIVMNSGAATLQVFGTTPDTINDVATATGVAVGTGKCALFFCPTAAKWYMLLGA